MECILHQSYIERERPQNDYKNYGSCPITLYNGELQ